MPIPSAYGETLVRLRGTKVSDGYNGTRIDWANPARLTMPGCGLAPRVEDENRTNGRQAVTDAWTAYVPFGADIGFEDRVECRWGTFEVEGTPGHWRSPLSGREHGTAVHLRRVDG